MSCKLITIRYLSHIFSPLDVTKSYVLDPYGESFIIAKKFKSHCCVSFTNLKNFKTGVNMFILQIYFKFTDHREMCLFRFLLPITPLLRNLLPHLPPQTIPSYQPIRAKELLGGGGVSRLRSGRNKRL